ncbi:MAG: HD domain-containing protein, partial [bacterium]|nr:HD domain-containing protein [bacterium]
QGRKKTEIKYADSLREDVLRRDFSVNGLAMNPLTEEIVDYVNGKKDIDAKLIRFIGRPSERIIEDPLRILRAIRFKNSLEFEYDEAAKNAIKEAVKKGQIGLIANERIGGELTLMLANSSRRQALEDLDELGIIEKILPELAAGKGVDQGPQFHSEGDVWAHQLLIMEHLGEDPSKKLVWTALLHDIGKPVTQTLPKDSKDRIRFNEHDFVGARMAKKILKRLKFSSEDIEDICWMIRYHIVISQLSKMRRSKQLKYLSHPSFAQMLKLYEADGLASWHQGPGGKVIKKHKKTNLDEIEELYQDYLSQSPEKRQPSLKKDLGIDGNWLQKEYKIKEGPDLGKILTQLQENYQDGQIKNKKDAHQFVEDFIKRTKAIIEKVKNR